MVENNIMGNATHTYMAAGTYEVKIVGDLPRVYIAFGGEREKIQTIK
ncbi:MAG: hypothetical protein Sapg2KO_13340 [Saprospiraceae bacterium]